MPRLSKSKRKRLVWAWLEENCGADGWAMTSSGSRGVLNAPVDLSHRCYSGVRVPRSVGGAVGRDAQAGVRLVLAQSFIADLAQQIVAGHDKSADRRQSLETKPISRGTEGSNPAPSSSESSTNRSGARRSL